MTLIARKTNSTPIEAGTYQAICYMVCDLGTQFNEFFGSKNRKVLIGWEMPKLRIEIEREGVPMDLPRVISKTYTLSLHEKSNLSKDLISWRGKSFTGEEAEEFDVHKVLGVNCLLTIINVEKNSNLYANVSSVAKLMAGMTLLKPENPIIKYSMEEQGQVIPEGVYPWVKDIIKKSEEFKFVESATAISDKLDAVREACGVTDKKAIDDDIPF